MGWKSFATLSLRVFQRTPDPAVQPCPARPPQAGRLPYSPLGYPPRKPFSNTSRGQTRAYFAEAGEASERSPHFKVFSLIFVLQKRNTGVFHQTDQHIIDKSPSSLERAFCTGNKTHIWLHCFSEVHKRKNTPQNVSKPTENKSV